MLVGMMTSRKVRNLRNDTVSNIETLGGKGRKLITCLMRLDNKEHNMELLALALVMMAISVSLAVVSSKMGR